MIDDVLDNDGDVLDDASVVFDGECDVFNGNGDVLDDTSAVFDGECDVIDGTDGVVELSTLTKDTFI